MDTFRVWQKKAFKIMVICLSNSLQWAYTAFVGHKVEVMFGRS